MRSCRQLALLVPFGLLLASPRCAIEDRREAANDGGPADAGAGGWSGLSDAGLADASANPSNEGGGSSGVETGTADVSAGLGGEAGLPSLDATEPGADVAPLSGTGGAADGAPLGGTGGAADGAAGAGGAPSGGGTGGSAGQGPGPSGPDASDDNGDAAGAAVGTPCTSNDQCAGSFCVDGYCCDGPCNNAVCQRCDTRSALGAGHCGYNREPSDPDHECSASTFVCTSKCATSTTTWACSGTGYACVSSTTTGNVASGQVCASNVLVAVSESDYCETGKSCAAGACQGSVWWTSCNGAGACRSAEDPTDAYSQLVYAQAGYTLDSDCRTDDSLDLCDGTSHCDGHTQYGGYACNSSHQCTVDAKATTCCGCGNYGCSVANVCQSSCVNTNDCAAGAFCVTTVDGYKNTCQAGRLNDPCDVPATNASTLGAGCATGLVCTADHHCKAAPNATCTVSADCGIGFWNSTTPAGGTQLVCEVDGVSTAVGTLHCTAPGGYCCGD